MRLTVLVLLSLLASPAVARDDWRICHSEYIPDNKRRVPTVEYHVFYMSPQMIRNAACENPETWGCVSQEGDNLWHIYIDRDLHPSMRHCVLMHEMAHLPPNLWDHTRPAR
jgi:hypothetical protein